MRSQRKLIMQSAQIRHSYLSSQLRKRCKAANSSFARMKQQEKTHMKINRNQMQIQHNTGKNSQRKNTQKDFLFKIDSEVESLRDFRALKFNQFCSHIVKHSQKKQYLPEESCFPGSNFNQPEFNGVTKTEKVPVTIENNTVENFTQVDYNFKLSGLLSELFQKDLLCSKKPTLQNLCALKQAFISILVIKEKRLKILGEKIEKEELCVMLHIQQLIEMIEYRVVLTLIFPYFENISYYK